MRTPHFFKTPTLLFLIGIFFWANTLQAQFSWDLKEALKKPKKVTGLMYRTNNSDLAFPKDIFKLVNLQHLDVSSQYFKNKEFPSAIGQLRKLKHLEISNNQFNALPDEMKSLKNLRYLNLGSNQFTSLPKVLSQMPHLDSLVLGENPFTDIGQLIKQIAQIKSLKYLELLQINLKGIDLSVLKQLKSLKLSGCGESGFLQSLTKLKNLQALGLRRFQDFPTEVLSLKQLTYLNLMKCRFNNVPKEIAQLTNLESLSFYRGAITDLPTTIGKLKKLTHLNIGRTKITVIPEIVKQLKQLKRLNVRRLKISDSEKQALKKALPNTKIIF